MKVYDYIMAGGGSAGLALAHHLISSPLKDRSMLIIDRDAKNRNDRTWCFWTQQPTLVDAIIYRAWDYILFATSEGQQRIDVRPYQYKMVRGIDFYRFTREALSQHPNVEFLQGTVEQIEDGPEYARVMVDGQSYAGRWVFDSLFIPDSFQPDTRRYYYVKQHFRGWEIETSGDVFDPTTATLFDFRTPQHGVMRFFYILPFSPRRALVEYTLFSPTLLAPEEYDAAIQAYIHDILKVENYRIVDDETGLIPMTDQPFPRRGGQRILYTGTKGGRVKASSGFAFLRTQQDAAAIVASLLRTGHPFDLPTPPARYHWFDALLLQVLYRHGELAEGIYTALFSNNPIERIFRFLDEQGSWVENVQLMATLPPGPFLRAWLRSLFRLAP